MNLTIVSYNIRFGGRGRESILAEVIQSISPDIVIFQEATMPSVIEKLAEASGMHFWAAKPNHSIAYCSRVEIESHQWHYPPGSRHAFLEIVPRLLNIHIFGLHLRAMFSKWGERRRTREIQQLLTGIKEHQAGLHALVGDFNSLAPGESLDKAKLPHWIQMLVWLSGRDMQRETVQLVRNNGYVDAFRKINPQDAGYTFPTADPHVRLDYLFLPESHSGRIADCRVVQEDPAPTASDHFPLLTRIELP